MKLLKKFLKSLIFVVGMFLGLLAYFLMLYGLSAVTAVIITLLFGPQNDTIRGGILLFWLIVSFAAFFTIVLPLDD